MIADNPMFSVDDEALLVPGGGAHRAPTRLMARLQRAGGLVHENGQQTYTASGGTSIGGRSMFASMSSTMSAPDGPACKRARVQVRSPSRRSPN